MNSIHEIEKKSLPEFFTMDSRFKTPIIYKEFRDFMINTYRLNPIEYLTITAVRRGLAGDVASIMRVHGFLMKWGLINYQIDPKTKPFLVGPQYTGHFQITLDKPTGLEPYIPKDVKIVNDDEKRKSKEVEEKGNDVELPPLKKQNTTIPLNLELRHNIYDSTQDAFTLRSEETNKTNSLVGLKQLYCSITGNDITETRYHNLKTKQNISSKAFEDGQFPSSFKSTDYIKLNKIYSNSDIKPWSDQELLLLFEAIEMYQDDWNSICGHVGSRTKDQCISKFIQLPIEDKYLEKQLNKQGQEEFKKSLLNGKFNPVKTVNDTMKHLIESNEKKSDIEELTIKSLLTNANDLNKEEIQLQTKLLSKITELSFKRFDLKLSKLENLEKELEKEKKQLALAKHNLIIDRLSLRKQTESVRSKLIKASELGATDEGLLLCEEAMIEANKAPRIVVVNSNSKSELSNITNSTNIPNGDEGLESDQLEPISVKEPQSYTMWSA
ncbi:hypothetical protein CANARDRAFT_121900 [[Candida] arabinofermentans NRRL YB-2248]|uniref:SWIRM domain-containing protein n=1 Tax=[Candida] arabinofermentans NRRL YB-2248 TaxID=983967 RepID=A0A1E4T5I0_9ASCO|nr:hypothetical protein CANARDRAFT_121900 [[Candida] arabinofermentans NRRL YB-2248]